MAGCVYWFQSADYQHEMCLTTVSDRAVSLTAAFLLICSLIATTLSAVNLYLKYDTSRVSHQMFASHSFFMCVYKSRAVETNVTRWQAVFVQRR